MIRISSLAGRFLAAAFLVLCCTNVSVAQQPRLGIRIDRDRSVILQNLGEGPIEFNRLGFESLSGLLDTENWRSISEFAFEEPETVVNLLGVDALTFSVIERTPNRLLEETLSGSAVIQPGAQVSVLFPYLPDYETLKELAHNGELRFFFGFTGTPIAYSSTVWKPIDGDVNFDDSVDLDDFAIMKSNFGQDPAFWEDGDLDELGHVDLEDFSILKENFGNTADSLFDDDLGGIIPVPEPPSRRTGLLAVIAGCAAASLCRREKN